MACSTASPIPRATMPSGDELKSEDGKFTILGTMTDQFDRAKAKANVEDTVTRHPDITGMVGLFEYNPPLMLEALDRTGKLGKVKVMGFDENPATLQGIKDGNCGRHRRAESVSVWLSSRSRLSMSCTRATNR